MDQTSIGVALKKKKKKRKKKKEGGNAQGKGELQEKSGWGQ